MLVGSERILASLRDVAGVEGSWLLDNTGALAGRDLSAMYPDDLISGLGSRLRQMTEAAAEHLAGRDDDLCLRFESRALFVRKSGQFLLVVLALPTVNLQSLRIGAHLVMRQLASTPPSTPAAAAPPRAISAPLPAVPRPAPARAVPPQQPPQPPPKKSSGIWGD